MSSLCCLGPPRRAVAVIFRSYFHSLFQCGHWMVTVIREGVRPNVWDTPIPGKTLPGVYIEGNEIDYLQDFIMLVFCLITGIQHFSSLTLERDICFLSVISQKVFQEAVSFHPSSWVISVSPVCGTKFLFQDSWYRFIHFKRRQSITYC